MPSEKEKMLAGERYDASDPELVAARERANELTREYNRTDPSEADTRQALIEDLFGSVGEGFYANFDCVVLDVCQVDIGDDCLLGPGVHIYTATHPLDPDERRSGVEYGKPVTIGDNVWVGGQAVINPDVTVGDDAVIGSGSVVTDDVPAGVVVQGNPASVVREIED
ncbi:sugar O-acetyltransferase [Haloarcula argentinensis]|uniref:Maltose O-acetyltransferase n=1 Tax=Haloarcula argentinensis TaxID=43776 RepID=A0A830FMJ9_HALAR|nr:sugar O-acetyltransferase [Haloarcula argentinensis]GGM39247.1 maltose O-acetyltransferase [Haloarcula argentinensis]